MPDYISDEKCQVDKKRHFEICYLSDSFNNIIFIKIPIRKNQCWKFVISFFVK